MIHSMTAYGRSRKENTFYRVDIEMRCLNGRRLDIIVRFPKNYLEYEETARKVVGSRLRRGRVEIFATIQPLLPTLAAPTINPVLARHYWNQLRHLHLGLPGSPPPGIGDLIRMPEILESSQDVVDPSKLLPVLNEALQEAMDHVVTMRAKEGRAMMRDLLSRLDMLGRSLATLEERRDEVTRHLVSRVRDRMTELLRESGVQVDEGRILQEAAILADRQDIHEETVRIASHLAQMDQEIGGEPLAEGRRLDFLAQELHREVNTVGSKCNDLEISRIVVDMKNEIGKLREQIQNVE